MAILRNLSRSSSSRSTRSSSPNSDKSGRGTSPFHEGKLVVGHVAVAEGTAVNVDDAGDAIRTGIRRGMRDRAPTAVADEHDGFRDRIDNGDHGVDVVSETDVRAVRVSRLEAWQG